jgi:hypothetical protein
MELIGAEKLTWLCFRQSGLPSFKNGFKRGGFTNNLPKQA